MNKFEPKKLFSNIGKTNDDVIFPGLGLEAKIETETSLGVGLGKILRYRSWSRMSQSRLQPW